MEDEAKRGEDQLAAALVKRQYRDWRTLRHKPFTSVMVKQTLEALARDIDGALCRTTTLRQTTTIPGPQVTSRDLKSRVCEPNQIRMIMTDEQTPHHPPRATVTSPQELPPVTTPRLGKLPPLLTEEELRDFCAEFTEWTILETPDGAACEGLRREIYRAYEFPTFDLAWRFMNNVANHAIRPLNHHPRWQNNYIRVEVWLTTYNRGYRPSTKDRRLACELEKIWRELQSVFAKQRQVAQRGTRRK